MLVNNYDAKLIKRNEIHKLKDVNKMNPIEWLVVQ